MGRYYWSKKSCVGDYDDLDVFWLKKNGYFCGWKSGGISWTNQSGTSNSIGLFVSTHTDDKYAQFTYTITDRDTGEKTNYNYNITITTTPCTYGGVRYWFICPLTSNGRYCGRRVGKVFLGDKYFGCRHCYNLSYNSRNETKSGMFSYLGRMFKYEKKLEKLEEQTKISYRQGIPTKKYLRILQLQRLVSGNAETFISMSDKVLGKRR